MNFVLWKQNLEKRLSDLELAIVEIKGSIAKLEERMESNKAEKAPASKGPQRKK